MKYCRKCRFYDGQICKIKNQKKTPTSSCSNFVEYKGN